MERKLIKQGVGGYTIYLPKKWVESQQLDNKSVELAITNQGIIITPKGNKIKSSTEIHLESLTETSVRAAITYAYRTGFDKVTVHYKDKKQFEWLNEVINNQLLGFEITSNENNICVIESITEPSREKFEILIEKIFYNISELIDAVKNNVQGKKVSLDETELRILKYDSFCRRVIAKQKYEHEKSELMWTFLVMLSSAQRDIYHTKELLSTVKNKEAVLQALKFVKEIKEQLQKAYLTKNVIESQKVHTIYQTVSKETQNLITTLTGKDILVVHNLLSSIRRFYLTSNQLFGQLI